MALTHLIAQLVDDPWHRELAESLRALGEGQALEVESVPVAARAPLLASLIRQLERRLLILTARHDQAFELQDALSTYLPSGQSPLLWPAPETLPYDLLVPDRAASAERVALLRRLATDPSAVVIAPVRALTQLLSPPETLWSQALELRVGATLSLRAFLARLLAAGYQRAAVVGAPGQFSHRGGIVDLWSPGSRLALRVELFGDEIESIRRFDPETQRSVERIQEASVLPPVEVDQSRLAEAVERLCRVDTGSLRPEVLAEWERLLAHLERGELAPGPELFAPFFLDRPVSLLDYLPATHLVVVMDPGAVYLALEQIDVQAQELRATLEDSGELPRDLPLPYHPLERVLEQVGRMHQLLLGSRPPQWPAGGVTPFAAQDRYTTDLPNLAGRLGQLPSLVEQFTAGGWRLVLASEQRDRLTELLEEHGIFPRVQKESPIGPDGHGAAPLEPGTVEVARERLNGGWKYAGQRLLVLSDRELFGYRRAARRPSGRPRATSADLLQRLKPGSYVVHVEHGIARYGGLVTLEISGVTREYLLLEYADNDRLYLPVDQLDRITLYESFDGEPSLTRLGSPEWSRIKRRVRQAVRELAFDLLQLYAAREAAVGHAFSPDTAWDHELEESFPYEETPDQLRAIQEIKADMERPRPMDRLLCGDVGFGKTEVAVRAAFKAVNDGFQVAILVPTTVLALQHYTTFQQRLAPFPVRVEMLSRLRDRREQAEIVEAIARGEVDIVIGTHRLLQRDVRFKRLGLVIIDEEQRFGVAHKEHFKRLRTNVDVLTMTATPIPRTLYLALSGIRDLSVINTPPLDRAPVRTFVTPARDTVVREAILREIARGGQVYVVHNRVQSISHLAARLQRLVPEARFAIAHGQMPEEELERVILAFIRQEFDVLVCTTIIESGVDIPNVNTIIIDQAHTLGLTQLYQLRGRVGRSYQRAYAYLLYDDRKPLSKEAQARLEAIQEATELGAGFQIALRDLEIRGAGNVLGPEQSGHIAAVGFELYTQLLARAVEEIKQGRPIEEPTSVTIDLPVEATIPESYCGDEAVRMSLYQRFARIRTLGELRELVDELVDRFGPLPPPVERMVDLARLRVRANGIGITSIIERDGEVYIRPVIGTRLDQAALRRQLGPGVYVTPHQVRLVTARLATDAWQAVVAVLDAIEEASATLLLSAD
ncbi:Transcription-repair-coupling factor [bacterium HR26]|nr:Transcription-repair-coupling factor [bacterium HR26]